MPRLKDLVGQTYGNLTVLERATVSTAGKVHWVARCNRVLENGSICGKTVIVQAGNLISGRTSSCGCGNDGHWNVIHGATRKGVRDVEYNSWENMIRRCEDKSNKRYDRYGGRGIVVCNGFHDFVTFRKVLGLKPSKEHSIDRKENDGHYSCGTCDECVSNGWKENIRWATRQEQAQNTSRNHFVDLPDGRRVCVTEVAREVGMNPRTLSTRLETMPVEEALKRPVRLRKQS